MSRTIFTLRKNASHHRHRLNAVRISQQRREMSSNTVNDAKQETEDHNHCVDLVRERDMEGYLCGLLMPSQARKSYFAIRAFNAEIASVKDGGAIGRHQKQTHQQSSSSSLASNLRMTWWREAVDDIYNDLHNPSSSSSTSPPSSSSSSNNNNNNTEFISKSIATARKQNPIVRSLQTAVQTSNLTKRFLDRMMDAREQDLERKSMHSIDDLVQYGEDTTSSFLYLSLECAGVHDSNADQCASHIGVAHGLVTSLRSTLYKSSRGELSITDDLMRKHSVPSRYVLHPPMDRYDIDDDDSSNATKKNNDEYKLIKPEYKDQDEALRSAVKDVALISRAHLSEARGMQSLVPKAGRPCLLPAVSALYYLEQLESVDYDVLHPKINEAPEAQRFNVALLLGRAWLTGVF